MHFKQWSIFYTMWTSTRTGLKRKVQPYQDFECTWYYVMVTINEKQSSFRNIWIIIISAYYSSILLLSSIGLSGIEISATHVSVRERNEYINIFEFKMKSVLSGTTGGSSTCTVVRIFWKSAQWVDTRNHQLSKEKSQHRGINIVVWNTLYTLSYCDWSYGTFSNDSEIWTTCTAIWKTNETIM